MLATVHGCLYVYLNNYNEKSSAFFWEDRSLDFMALGGKIATDNPIWPRSCHGYHQHHFGVSYS